MRLWPLWGLLTVLFNRVISDCVSFWLSKTIEKYYILCTVQLLQERGKTENICQLINFQIKNNMEMVDTMLGQIAYGNIRADSQSSFLISR